MNFRKHNSSLEETEYNRLGREENPKRNKDLEYLLQTPSINPENGAHGNFLTYSAHNILSKIFSPVREAAVTGGLLLAIAACGGQGTISPLIPTPNYTPPPKADNAAPQPTKTPEIKIDFEKLSTPNISSATNDGTYNIIFPFKEPSSSLENFVYYNTDVVTYMKFVRAKEGVKFAISFADLINQTWNPLNWREFFKRDQELGKLIPYVPLEDILTFQQSKENYQGTRVEAEEVVYQRGPNNELIKIPNNNPEIDEQKYNELSQAHLDQEETHPLEWAMQNGPHNSGFVDVTINLPLSIEWDVEIEMLLSRASILGDSLYVYGEGVIKLSTLTGEIDYLARLTPVGGTPAAMNEILITPGYLTASEASRNTNSALFAMDPETTESIWKIRMLNPKTPIIDGETVYIVDQGNQLQSRNVYDGSLYWDFNLDDSLYILGSPKITDDDIYFLGTLVGHLREYSLYSLSKNGNLNWVEDITPDLSGHGYLEDYEFLSGRNGIPILAGNFLIWENLIQRFKDNGDFGDRDYCLEAFNLETRSIALDQCIGPHPFGITSKITDGTEVYVSSENQILRYTAEGNELRQLSTISMEDTIYDLVMTENQLFVATDVGITAIDRTNQNIRQKIHDFRYEKDIKRIHMSVSGGDLYVVAVLDAPNHVLKFSSP